MKPAFFLLSILFCAFSSGVAQSSPLLCGHRGGFEGNWPENSLSRFDEVAKAFGDKAFMVELDVRESADGVLFVLHDETLERTTNGQGKIAGTPSRALKKLLQKDPSGKLTSENLLRWDKALQWLAKHPNARFMVDTKGEIHEKVIQRSQHYGLEGQCLLLTFSLPHSELVAKLTSKALISCLVSSESDWDNIRQLNLPSRRQVIYVNDKTPLPLLSEMKKTGVAITADVSESRKNQHAAFPKDYYTRLVAEKMVDILITDFPVEVKGYFL
ncbi:MAG: glycerophosphodiester phosphodiesterase family protein [Haliscomenobacter sp.]|nr:glycerophosphodiester phosphodiesterase family protein [Haliscomenobacter sp.]